MTQRDLMFCLQKLQDILMQEGCLYVLEYVYGWLWSLKSLLWASWDPVAVSSTETQTPAAFSVADLCLPLMSALLPRPWPQRHCVSTNHLRFKTKQQQKKKHRNNSLLLTCFYYLTGEEKLFDIHGQKNKLFGSGHSGVSDWLTAWAKFPGSVFVSNCFSNSPRLERVFASGRKMIN